MSDGSVAPKERINIKFVPTTGGAQEEIELPLKMMVLGDFTGKTSDEPIDSRPAVSVDKNNFSSVLKEMKLERQLEVPNRLQDGDDDATLRVNLKFEELRDFAPDRIAQNVPELKKMVELRDALTALKGPLGNLPQFRKALAELIDDDAKRDAILSEIDKETPSTDAD